MKNVLRIFLLFAAAFACAQSIHAQVVIIANPSVAADSVSKGELRNLFTGASSTLGDGSHVKPVLLKEGPTHAAFTSSDLNLSPVAVTVCWRNLVFSGQAAMPKSFESEADVVAFVAHTRGAIGYIGSGVPHEGVKVLAVR